MTDTATDPINDVADRVVDCSAAMLDIISIAMGDRLGYYSCLADHGPLSPGELAAATRTSQRYVREWLEQQAVTGFVDVTADGTFGLAPGVAEVLAAPDELSYLAPMARQIVAAAARVPEVPMAMRTGGGVAWSAYGADMRESQAEMNRPGFLTLVPEWFAAMPDVHERLSAGGVRVADIGCGGAWSSIGMARAYPQVTVDAFDLDAPTVEMARRNIAEAGLADRVTARREDIGMVEIDQPYALVTAFECLHDMPYPVAALRAMRKLADPDGVVLIADMKVPERFEPPGDLVERLMYGFSLTVCLPDSMSSEGSSATGTVMREPILRDYAARAGFTGVTTLDVDHEIWRFYRLQP